MLYDKRWDKTTEVKSDPFSLDTLIAWLEKQPADTVYCYFDGGTCLLAQYFTAMGFEGVEMRPRDFDHVGAYGIELPRRFNMIAINRDFSYRSLTDAENEYTFGAALDRARMFRGQR